MARLYPSYTTAQLKVMLSTVGLDAETMTKIMGEIEARESGKSQVAVTPQIEGGKVMAKVGRL